MEEEHDRLTNATEIILYEMPKLEPQVQNILAGKTDINSLPEDEKWCMFMKYPPRNAREPVSVWMNNSNMA